MKNDIPIDETPEAERRRVFGACGGKCGEAPCIEWNKENQRRLRHKKERESMKNATITVFSQERADHVRAGLSQHAKWFGIYPSGEKKEWTFEFSETASALAMRLATETIPIGSGLSQAEATAYLSLPTNAPLETVLATLDKSEFSAKIDRVLDARGTPQDACLPRKPFDEYMADQRYDDMAFSVREERIAEGLDSVATLHGDAETHSYSDLGGHERYEDDLPPVSYCDTCTRPKTFCNCAGALHAPKNAKPIIPSPQAPLYMAALDAFWTIVVRDYPDAEKIIIPQSVAQAFEKSAASVVEAWLNLYNSGGYNSGKFGGERS